MRFIAALLVCLAQSFCALRIVLYGLRIETTGVPNEFRKVDEEPVKCNSTEVNTE
jgi:hypothetical protein